MRNNKKLLLLLLLFPMAFLADRADACKGKLDGSLHGYVTDAVTKKPLPGVVVSAIFPGTNNYKEVLTDSDGYFHFPILPVTPVTVQFDKKGYQAVKKSGVQIKDKTTIKLNVEFLPEGVDADDKDKDKEEPRDSESSEYPLYRMLQ